jgi:hypothetical protein
MIALQGPYPSNTERAFTLFEACLEQSEPGGCNEGLLRPDADLHLVGISDEPEQSEHAWDHYLPLFEGYLADHSKLVVHGVGADNPTAARAPRPTLACTMPCRPRAVSTSRSATRPGAST